jgi:hypothetical protein
MIICLTRRVPTSAIGRAEYPLCTVSTFGLAADAPRQIEPHSLDVVGDADHI